MKTVRVLLTTFLLILISTPVLAVEYSGIGGRPTYPREDDPRTESIFVYDLEVDTEISDAVTVINNTDEEKTILVYATDTTPSSGGGFACKQLSEEVTATGTWLKLEKTEVTLKPNSNEIVPFTLTIPENTSVGEHNACIAIQEKIIESEDYGLHLSFRSAMRVLITIPGEIIKDLEITKFAYTEIDEGKAFLNIDLKNNGNVSLDADINIITKNKLTKDEFGSVKGTYTALRNEIKELNFPINKSFWGGFYKSSAKIEYDENKDLLEKEISYFMTPSTYAYLIYASSLLILILISILIIKYKNQLNRIKKNWVKYDVKTSDTLIDIAENKNVNWKLLAKANKLKAPYILKKGQILKVPKE